MMEIHFAPLQGYTEDAYRRLHCQLFGGVSSYYTPFVRLEHKEIRSKDWRDMRPEFNEGVPVVPQIICGDGKEAETLVEAVSGIGYRRIDINMGCPFPLQTRHGKGAGLLMHPEKVKEICDVIRRHKDISFSVKMRLGLENKNEWRTILPLLNDVRLEHITLHPRIASQQYRGEVNMEEFAEFLKECRHPVIYNGDIRTVEDIRRIEELCPILKGVMIGRGLLARPSLACEYEEGRNWSKVEILTKVKQMHSLLQEHYEKVIPGEAQQLQKLRTFWDYYEPTDETSLLDRKQWKKVKKAGNMKNYLSAVEEIR